MRTSLTVRRGRDALASFVVAGSLVVMGAQCQPTKPPSPPSPTPAGHLTISPTSHDFGDCPTTDQCLQEGAPFTVTNEGPGRSGYLTVTQSGSSVFTFYDFCGPKLDPGETCGVFADFLSNPNTQTPGLKTRTVVVGSDHPADGTATATVTATLT